MTEREQEIVRLALVFLLANRDAAIEAFDVEEKPLISVNGIEMNIPTEEEISNCLKLC